MRSPKEIRTEPLEAEKYTIGGVFECQQCGEDSEEADYYFKRQVLTWTCSQGHNSVIEKFKI
jgi:hypothetical protein